MSVTLGCILTSILAGCFKYFGGLTINDIVAIWVYDIVCLLIIDVLKVTFLNFMGIDNDVISDEELRANKAAIKEQKANDDRVSSNSSATQRMTMSISSNTDVEVLMAAHSANSTTSAAQRRKLRAEAQSVRLSEWAGNSHNSSNTNNRSSVAIYKSTVEEANKSLKDRGSHLTSWMTGSSNKKAHRTSITGPLGEQRIDNNVRKGFGLGGFSFRSKK